MNLKDTDLEVIRGLYCAVIQLSDSVGAGCHPHPIVPELKDTQANKAWLFDLVVRSLDGVIRHLSR